GALVRHKTLSSAVVNGTVAEGSTDRRIVDPDRAGDHDDFWRGAELRLLSAEGQVAESGKVAGFDSAATTLVLASAWKSPPEVGARYEIVSGSEAPLLAMHQLLGIPLEQPLPACSVRLG